MPLIVNDDLLGLLIAQDTDAVDLARAAANQIGVAIKKIEVIEELLEKNLIRDFFEQLANRHAAAAAAGPRAARLGCDLDRPHVVLIAAAGRRAARAAPQGAVPGGARRPPRRRAARAAAGRRRRRRARRSPSCAGCTRRSPTRRAIGALEPVRRRRQLPRRLRGGALRARRRGAAARRRRRSSATRSSASTSTCCGWRSTPACATPSATRCAACSSTTSEHNTALLATLEEFLLRRGNISATSEALYIHPNTLRQRLRRISELTGIDLGRDDWLVLEVALKLLKLQRVLGDDAHTRELRGM